MFRKNSEELYDERQIRERGMIFKTSFFLIILYHFIIGVLTEIADFPIFEYFDYFQVSFIGIMLTVTVCTIMMITKNAYVSPLKPYYTHITVGLSNFCTIVTLIGNIKYFDWFNLTISICILIICCTYWIKFFIDKKKINIDDED